MSGADLKTAGSHGFRATKLDPPSHQSLKCVQKLDYSAAFVSKIQVTGMWDFYRATFTNQLHPYEEKCSFL